MFEELDRQRLKTVVQISQYVNGQFIKGSKAHTVYGCSASDVIALLEPLREKHKKVDKPPYVIRMQVLEYQREREKYRKQRGGCITLYDVFINDIFEEVGKLLEHIKDLIDRSYETQIHHGMWCLCRQSAGKSVVLEIDSSPHKLFAAKEKYSHITYVIDPEGRVTYKGEIENGFF